MFLLRPFLFVLLLWITAVEGCVRTIPPEEYYPSSTLPMETDLCKTCRIDDIEPENLPAGTVFESTPIATTGDCISTTAKCSRTDGKVCTSVTISSVTSTGSTVLGTTPNGNEVSTRLDCEDNGLYSSGATSRIIQLACEFTGCELLCTTCDIIPMAPTGLPAEESFEYSQTAGPDGCITAPVSCKRTDGLICQKISLQGPGGVEITSGTSTTSTGTTLTCQGDGKFGAGGVSGIDQLSCVFTDCSACTTCDISTIAPPTPAPTGTMFESEELAAPGACKSTKVTCSRTDGQICVGVAVQATISSGTADVITSANSDTATGTLTCGPDGFYLANGQQISQLTCFYTDCEFLCSKCDIAAWAPTGLPTGQSFEYTTLPPSGNCVAASATCKRTDNFICSSIALQGPGGVTISSQTNTGALSNVLLECQGDGTFAANGVTGINQFSCAFTSCVTPCQSCDSEALVPTNPPADISYMYEQLAISPCKISQITCKNANDLICEKITITGTTPGGTVILTTGMNARQNSAYLYCQTDGTIKDISGQGPITAIDCQLTVCKPPCETCDITQYFPSSTPADSSFEYTETVVPGSCTQVEITCKRTDTQVCDIGIRMLGYADFASGTQVDSVSAMLTCDNNGYFAYGGTTIDMELACVYNNCVEKCLTCDATAIAPVMQPGTSFVATEDGTPGGCKQTEMICKRDDTRLCTQVSIVATTPSGDVVLNNAMGTAVTQAGAYLLCGADGKYDAGGPVSQIKCNFVGCKPLCATCNFAALPVMKSVATIVIQRIEQGTDANGCSKIKVQCYIPGALSCSVLEITGTTPSGPIDIKSGTTFGVAVYTEMTCSADGASYSFNGMSGVTSVQCTVICP